MRPWFVDEVSEAVQPALASSRESSFSTVCVSGDGCSATAEPVGQSMPSMMRKSRSTLSERTASAFW